MSEPEVASRRRSAATNDRVTSLLIGVVAILAGVFAVQQAHAGIAGSRAQVQAARLSDHAAARLSSSSFAENAGLLARQGALVIGIESLSRQMTGTQGGDDAAVAVGATQQASMDRLNAAIDETARTSGGPPVDAYAAGLVTASLDAITAEVAEQNRQVDLAATAGARQLWSVLGLSLVALAGVLAGIAAVLRAGRAGWLLLAVAWTVARIATVTAVRGVL